MRRDYNPRLAIRGEGRAVILVPGMNGTPELFYRQVPLLERSHRVATYALRDDAESLDVLAADLAGIVDAVTASDHRAVIVGESFGGAVALTFALQYPDRVEALIILNSFPHFAPQVRLRMAIAGLRILPWGAMSLVRHLTAFRLHSPHTHRAEVTQFIAATAHASRDGYINRLRLLKRFDVRDRLGDIQCPTLFLAAENDHLVPAITQARYMARRVPSAVMRVLKGHGHICLIAPDVDLARLLDEWDRPRLCSSQAGGLMPTARESSQVNPPVRRPRRSGDRRPKKRATPSSPGEGHIGATEAQVSRTMPPKADDDEPKQG